MRIILVVAVLGALAAIPASTQVAQGTSQAANAQAGSNLPMLLVVNRLELTRAQMETLRTTIRGLLDEANALQQKRGDFENEMIAFNGTAEELDVRIAAFESEMTAARTALQQKAAAAIDTLKETLTMKQGEILTGAFPGIIGRLGDSSGAAARVAPLGMTGSAQTVAAGRSARIAAGLGQMGMAIASSQAPTSATAQPTDSAGTTQAQSGNVTAGPCGCVMMQSGQAGMGMQSETTSAQVPAGVVVAAGKVQALAQRIRDRIESRLGVGADATATNGTAGTAAAAPASPSATAPCPMMGTMMSQSSSSASGETDVSAAGGEADVGSFGVVTISLPADTADATAAVRAGSGQLLNWLERLVQVLELKLAAMS